MPRRIKELLQSEYHTIRAFNDIREGLNDFGIDISEVNPRELFEEIIANGKFTINKYASVTYEDNQFKISTGELEENKL